jgi:hypothetical protein
MDSYSDHGEDSDKVTLNIYFHATVRTGARTTIDPNEVSEIGWFGADELPSDLAFPGHIPAVLRAWRESLEPAPRPTTQAARPASPRKPEPMV